MHDQYFNNMLNRLDDLIELDIAREDIDQEIERQGKDLVAVFLGLDYKQEQLDYILSKLPNCSARQELATVAALRYSNASAEA